MAPKAPPPSQPAPAAAQGGEPELPDGVYRKEISEEQLSGFYKAAYTSHEDMIKFLADVLGLRDISYKARNAIIVDYFSGFLFGGQVCERGWVKSGDNISCVEVEPRHVGFYLGGCDL